MAGVLCETHIRQAHAVLKRREGDEAVLALQIGAELAPLYYGFADVLKGADTFSAFGFQTFGLGKTNVHDYVRFSEYFSEDSAREFGITRMRRVPRLMDLAGITSFEGLLEHEFVLTDERTFRLADRPLPTTRDIEDAISVLKKKPARRHSRQLERERSAKEETLAPAYEKWPVLEKAGLKWVVEDSEVLLKNRALNAEQRVALARYILEVDAETE